MTTITHAEFVRHLTAGSLLLKYCQTAEQFDYAYAYCHGLRRCYHGEKYGFDEKGAKIVKTNDPSRVGFEDGLAGKPCDFQRFEKEAQADAQNRISPR
ncbi:hypothetical protein [Paraburkholderia phenoliruptrix]|uniref:hypothetical protein n=1 Tax=Paraburkholderia phenoliruptrix TaxID=252970 RepID=UPI0028698B86|nr:hypothetical protein [Paraburkholderia phenoliruptrix]WMY08652.1 hypothetical protein P3F88_02420 [Paraburkholderia phenoliruptrix]